MGRNTLAEEHFVPIEGYKNYEVSNYGRVCNVRTGADLKPRSDSSGFQNVILYGYGKPKNFGVHRLVAQAFFVDFNDDIEVKHISGDKTDNSVRNLTLGAPLRIKVRIVETGQEFSSMKACAEFLGVDTSRVSNILNPDDPHRTIKGQTIELVDKSE